MTDELVPAEDELYLLELRRYVRSEKGACLILYIMQILDALEWSPSLEQEIRNTLQKADEFLGSRRARPLVSDDLDSRLNALEVLLSTKEPYDVHPGPSIVRARSAAECGIEFLGNKLPPGIEKRLERIDEEIKRRISDNPERFLTPAAVYSPRSHWWHKLALEAGE